MKAQNCLACDVATKKIIPAGGIIFENDLVVVSHAIPPCQAKGFMIVAPKRHCEHIAELTPEEIQAISQAIHATSKALTNALKPGKVYVCSFGETIKHVHFYVIPRFSNMPKRGVTVLNEIIYKQKWDCSDSEAKEVGAKVKSEFQNYVPNHLRING